MAGIKGVNLKHGMSHSRPWVIWTDMKRRCKNPERNGFEFYGNKGIIYQESWENFECFWEDMRIGYSDELTLERINPFGNYCKDNCRWATKQEQPRNKKRYKNNNTGVDGTYLTINKGIETLKAHISDNGKRYTKNYSLNKYTLEEALILAAQWRKEMKEKLNYSEFHGAEG